MLVLKYPCYYTETVLDGIINAARDEAARRGEMIAYEPWFKNYLWIDAQDGSSKAAAFFVRNKISEARHDQENI